ncbi:MAG: PKD domain-containing protein, partial [Chitinophagales bacterium]
IWATTSSTNFVNYSSVRMFDGFEWKVYTPDNSNLPTTSRIEHINVATNGDVWMTAFGVGVLRFNGTDWTIYDSSNAPVSSTWNGSLLADKAGNIWVNSSVGLAKYDGTNWTSLPNLANLTLDAFGNIWGHTSNQISKYNGNTWQSYDVNNLPSSITSIAIANNDEVWLGTTDGVFKLNIITDEVISYTTDNSNLTNDYIYDVEINEVGQVWIAAHLNGLYRFDGTEWEHHFYPTNNSIEDIEIDANQDLWVAASHNISHFYRKLSADFTVDLNQLEVRFHALEGITTSYSWDFGDGNTSTNYAPLHTYSEEGVYNVCLTVANNCETVENCQEITIDLTCTAIPSFTSPSSTCASESLTFTNTSQNATSYEWFIDNISVSTQTDLTYNFPESGTYEIRLIAFSGDCEDSYTETITITPNANELDLGPDKTICEEGGITTLTANLANMEWYFWDKGGVAMGNTQSIEVSESGIYSLSVTDACINTAIDSIEVLIDDECVWPGDFNYDGIVNNLDLLPLGLAHDATGSLRPNASFEWEGQPCEEWSDLQPDGVNYKHIDGDGNGIIDLNDPQAIQLNYGKTHGNPNNTDSENDPNSDIVVLPVLESENAAFKPEGTPIRIGMHLQKNNNQPLAVYGFAFQIKYTGITVNDVLVDFTNSWMGTPNNDMTYIVKHRPNAKRIDVAITGIDHQNRIGSGEFGMLTIMVDDVLPTDDLLSFGVEMIGSELIDNQGIPTPLGGESEDFVVENQEICPDGIVVEYSNTSDLPLLTWAGGEIFVGNLDGTGNVVIGVGDEVELKAGHTIDIKPGTLVEMGAVLTVEIEECQEADNSPGKRGDDRQPQPPVGKEIELLIHPNPITDYTHIAYELPEDTKVSLYIVDKTGRRVQSLIQTKSQKAGEYRVTFEACAARMPAGIYYAVLETPFGLKTVKLVKTQ